MAAALLIAAPAASATVYHGSMDLSPAVNGITHMDASYDTATKTLAYDIRVQSDQTFSVTQFAFGNPSWSVNGNKLRNGQVGRVDTRYEQRGVNAPSCLADRANCQGTTLLDAQVQPLRTLDLKGTIVWPAGAPSYDLHFLGQTLTLKNATTPVPAPTPPPAPAPIPPPAPTPVPIRIGAICKDGWHSTATGSGACSGHGSVASWLYYTPTPTPTPAPSPASKPAPQPPNPQPKSIVCVVPQLKGMTLSKANTALGRAHCSLGKIGRPKIVRGHHTLHVASQSAKPQTSHPNHYRVNVTLR